MRVRIYPPEYWGYTTLVNNWYYIGIEGYHRRKWMYCRVCRELVAVRLSKQAVLDDRAVRDGMDE